MNEVFKPLTLPGADDSRPMDPSLSQTFGAAFNLENDVANLYAYINRPTYKADETFDFQAEFKKSQLPISWMPELAPSQSKAEFDGRLARIQKEYQDKAVLSASGWTGTVAALSAGMLSPTIFIPFAGSARGLKGMSQMLGLAAAGATAQNGALFLNQETRTEAEFYTGVAMDTLLMGMMGGAYLGLTGRARADLGNSIKYRENVVQYKQGSADLPNSSADIELDLNGIDGFETTARSNTLKIDGKDAELRYSRDADPSSGVANARQLEVRLSDNTVGAIEGEVKGTTLHIYNSNLDETLRGKGAGVKLYQEFIGRAMDEGLAVVSDDTVSATAARVYKSLEKQGYKIERAENVVTREDGRLETPDNSPVFRVVSEPSMAPRPKRTAIPEPQGTDARAVGAAPSRTRNTLGAKAAPNRVRQAAINALGKISPSFRMLTQPFFPSLRNAVAKLDMSGIQQAGLEVMQPSASGGTVLERIRGYDFFLVKFAKALDENFYNYIYDGAKGMDLNSPALTQLKSQIGMTPKGKMTWTEYKEAVFDGLNTGKPLPEVANSVAEFKEFFEHYNARQKQYMAEFAAQGIEVDPLFKELLEEDLGEGVANYAHHIFDQKKLIENMAEFIEDFSKTYERQLTEAFEKSKARYGKRKANLEFEKLVSSLDPTEVSARLDEVESDLTFLEEIPEWQNFREERLEINRQAKQEGWPKERLKQTLKDFQERQTADVKALQEERKQLMATAKVYRNFGGDAAEKTAKLEAEIEKADASISSMFRTLMPQVQRADISIASIQAKGDKDMKVVTTGIAKIVKEMQKRQARLTKLLGSNRVNSASRQKVSEQMERTRLKHEGMLERLAVVEGKQLALDDRLSELQLLREDAIAEANRVVRGRVARVEDLEDKLEKAEAKIVPPEERARMGAQIGDDLEKLDYDFQSLWSKRGDQSGDPVNTATPDFKERSVEMATMLHQKLTNSEVELSPAYQRLRQDARGAELLRVMKLPYDRKQKWLVKDVELVTRAYDRTMAPDLEIWRAFDGSVNGKSVLGEMQQEVTSHLSRISTAKFVKLPKGWVDRAAKLSSRVAKRITELGEADEVFLDAKNFSDTGGDGFVPMTPELQAQLSQSVHDATKAYTRDFDVAIQRLRYQRGVPQDPSSWWWRGGRMVKNLNVMTMMGGVVTSSISDVARPIWQHGAMKVFSKGWSPFINKLNPQAKEFRLRSKEINQRIGLNLEPVLHSRAQGVFDLAEESIGRTRLERATNVGAQKMGLIALYDYWTAGMKTISGNVVHATMAEYIPKVAEAWGKGAALEGDLLQMQVYLRNLGLSDLDINRIGIQMRKPDGVEYFSNGGVLPNVDKWDDMAAYQAYQAAVLGEVNKLIVTPGLERPNWVDENMGYSLLAQFKSFVFASNSRMAMSALQGNDPYLMQGIAFSLAFGALSYYTYALTAGGKTLEEANQMDPEKFLWEAVKRSGILGAMSIPTDAGMTLPSLTGEDTPDLFRKPSGLLGVVFGPTYSQAEKLADFLTKMDTEDPKQVARNMRKLRQVFVPFQNHFILRQIFDRVGEAMYGST